MLALVTPVYATYVVTGSSVQLCYGRNGEYVGAAALLCDFEYADASYVTEGEVNTYYKPKTTSYSCMFSNLN